MKKLTNIFKHALLLAMLCWTGSVLAEDQMNYWNLKVKDGSNTAKWLPVASGYSFGSTVDAGVFPNEFKIDGLWVKARYDSYDIDGFYLSFFVNNQSQSSNFDYYWREYKCKKCGYIDASNSQVYGLDQSLNSYATAAMSNPGKNTLKIRWEVKNNNTVISDQTKWSYVTFTKPGFTSTSTVTKDFGTISKGASFSTTISFTHYGDVPTKPEVKAHALDGCTSDPTKFEVVSITNSGVNVRFKTSGGISGTCYSAKIVITDKYSTSYSSKTIYLKGTVGSPQPEVLISDDADVKDGPQTTMHGYIKYTGCGTVTRAGFAYALGSTTHTPTTSNSTVYIDAANYVNPDGSTGVIKQGSTYNKTAYSLTAGQEYYYRAYIVVTGTGVAGTYYSSARSFTAGSTCSIAVGDTVYYTIDASKEKDLCTLTFPSLSDALTDMASTSTGHAAWKNNTSGDANYHCLTKPVVFEVVSGTYGNSDNSTRDTSLEDLNTKSVSSMTPSGSNPSYRLIIRAKDPNNKPVFKGGLSLLGARYVTLKNLKITRTSGISAHNGSAVEMGVYPSDAAVNGCVPGTFSKCNIEMIGCVVEATGFNCIHAAGCEGLVFDQCEFKMTKYTYGSDNDNYNCRDWGGSMKLMSCKNVQFTRNSFKGSHASTLFLQYAQNMLIMNNVFWNDNKYTQNVAFIRPVVLCYDNYTPPGKNQNIGIYYNTFYLGAQEGSSVYNVDFLRFGCYDNVYGCTNNGETCSVTFTTQKGNTSYYDASTIHFKYNNCYSYDTYVKTRHSDANAFQGVTLTSGNYDMNNFWGKATKAASSPYQFEFGTNAQNVNVQDQVCKSTATDPDELVVKGSALNLGSMITTDISGLNYATSCLADRFYPLIRPETGSGWTLGAFQQTMPEIISTIIWAGSATSGAWDKRSNWRTTDNKPVNCAHTFSDNLEVFIPDGASVDKIPVLSAWGAHTGTSNPRGQYPEEFVEAGLGSTKTPTQTTNYFKTINLANGAAIKGVENLGAYGSTTYYDDVIANMSIPRSKWVMIGSVVKPWDSDGPQYLRGVDLFLNEVPQVYLTKISAGEQSISWQKTYESLWTEISPTEAAAIRIPDQYGPTRLTAKEYYDKHDEIAEKDQIGAETPIDYKFWGRFNNESALPSYTGLTTGKYNAVSNTYPANIKVSELIKMTGLSAGTVYVYNSSTASFEASNVAGAASIIHPWQGFIINPTTSTVSLTSAVFTDGTATDTYVKSAEVERPYVALTLSNLYEPLSSVVQVTYDELKDDSFDQRSDAKKLFNNNEPDLPEMYIMKYDEQLQTVTVPSLANAIPLGLRLLKSMYVSFSLRSTEGLDQVILLDQQTGKEFDLLERAMVNFELPAGKCEGRFFLSLGLASGSSPEEPDVPTMAEEIDSESGEIHINNADNALIISSTGNIALERAYITDIAGRTTTVELESPTYNYLNLQGNAGVYIVRVVADSASRTEKVIVK